MESWYEVVGRKITETIKNSIRFRLNALRSIERSLTDIDDLDYLIQQQIVSAVDRFDVVKVKELIRKSSTKLEDWSFRQLRQEAYRLNVSGWSRLVKSQLIEALRKLQK